MSEKKIQHSPSDSDEGDNPKKFELIDKANEAAERLERANKEKERLLEREEKLAIERKLSGDSEAGEEEVKKSDAEKIKEGALKFWEGTGIAESIRKHG